ncbi:MobF family relaxase [Nocardia neocaledoniensis]|uniref:MobF family relaxase n=1 Tax=Nocardia neocaledoniensis TaxID=236511 RepID=UPI003402451D
MSLHKLGAGEGFVYFLRCIAVLDGSDRGRNSLDDYYTAKGERPGVWSGSGLVAFDTITAGDQVTEPQMASLFGEGLHPDAESITSAMTEQGASAAAIRKAVRLGRPFYQFAAPDESYRQACARAFEQWNRDHGRPATAAVAESERSQIRTRIAQEMFRAEFGRAPQTDRELSGWVARNSRPPRQAVAAIDLTFSPVKSVSALWAIAPLEVTAVIDEAHQAAVADALAFIEREACYTRLGTNGVRQVDVEGLIVAQYTHRDSRCGDPDLHTHTVVSNKVRTLDGRWRALDGAQLYRYGVAASEVYNSRLEHHLEQRLGVEFAERLAPTEPGKAPVREIVGIDENLCTRWSRRRAQVETTLTKMVRAFEHDHGREPLPSEVIRLSEKATVATRVPKHLPRSWADQRDSWRAEAIEQLGDDAAVDAMVARVLGRGARVRASLDQAAIEQIADRAIMAVSSRRATWREHHVRAEVERQLRGVVDGGQWQETAAAVMAAAMAPPRSIPRGLFDTVAGPGVLMRRDGTSVHVTAGSRTYTSPAIVAAEERLVAAAQLEGGRTVSAATVEMALLEWSANHDGQVLNPGQVTMVREFAASGRRVQVAIAPAGTGKTTSMDVLVRAWRAEGGSVLGLAPTAAAASVLEDETGIPTATIDMLVSVAARLEAGELNADDVPEWMTGVDASTLVIVDEAAKAATANLDAAVQCLLERGATVRMIGDDQQLSAVAAGGVLRDIAHTAGALSLTTVMRFADPGERAASLALRDGDPAALGFYADHDRIHVGTLGSVTERAFAAWETDLDTGLDTILLAPTRALVTQLNARARDARLAQEESREEREGRNVTRQEVGLSDGLTASIGDVITTRKNSYALRISATDHVRNGYRWTVREVHVDGRITAAHRGSGRLVTLPADYVAGHVTLGYASTIDSSQGMTVDSCHAVLTGREHRAQLYVAATRGRRGNAIYLGTGIDPTEPAPVTIEAQRPPTYLDVLTGVLARDGSQVSALSAEREAADPRSRLQHAADAYTDAVALVAEERIGSEGLAVLDAAADQLVPALTDEPAWPTLRSRLATIAAAGGDPIQTLRTAVALRELDSAMDRAAVLCWRIDPTGRSGADRSGPLPWVSALPERLAVDPIYGATLRAWETEVRQLADAVAAQAGAWTPTTAPMWARPLVDSDTALVTDLAVWRAAHGVAEVDRRRTGPTAAAVADRRAQRDLEHRVSRVLGRADADTRRWEPMARRINERIVEDPYWPVLAADWSAAAEAGTDVPRAAAAAAESGPLPVEQPAAALRWRMTAALDDRRAEPRPQRDAPADAQVRRELRRHWLRRISDTALAGHISSLQSALRNDRLHQQLERVHQQRKQSAVDEVIARHHQLDTDAEAIVAAQAAARALSELTDQREALRSGLAQTQRDRAGASWWQRKARRTAEMDAAGIVEDLGTLDQEIANARQVAAAAVARTHTHSSRWSTVVAQAGDLSRRQAELDAARESDREWDSRHQRDQERIDGLERKLARADVERQRRRGLSEAQRALERQVRVEIGESDPAPAQSAGYEMAPPPIEPPSTDMGLGL